MIPAAVPNGFREWPSIEFPQFLRELRFEDQSYHNDMCARAVRPLEGYSEEAGYPCLVAWCEHEKVEDREPPNKRYSVWVHAVADPCSDNDAIQVYEGDDPDACRRAIMALHGRVVGACDEGACFGSIVEFGEGCIYVLYDDEEWRDYEERESGAVRYILNHNADVIWATPCGASVLTLIDLMEVKK